MVSPYICHFQRDENLIRYFMVKKVKYLWDPDEDRYKKLRYLSDTDQWGSKMI